MIRLKYSDLTETKKLAEIQYHGEVVTKERWSLYERFQI